MAKKPFVTVTSKNVTSVSSRTEKAISKANLGNVVLDHLVEEEVEETKRKCKAITKKAVDKITQLNEECDKANNIKPNPKNDLISPDGAVASNFTREEWEKKQKPFNELEKVTTAFDAAIASGKPEDFYKLEKML